MNYIMNSNSIIFYVHNHSSGIMQWNSMSMNGVRGQRKLFSIYHDDINWTVVSSVHDMCSKDAYGSLYSPLTPPDVIRTVSSSQ